MPPLEEVLHYLKGVRRLLLLDASGLRWFDLSERGFHRSFWSMLWCFPFMIPTWIWWGHVVSQYGAPAAGTGPLFYFRMALTEYFLWMLPLLTVGLFMLLGGIGKAFDTMVIVSNWFSLPVYVITATLSALELLVPAPMALWSSLERLLAITVVIGQFCIFFVIARKSWPNAIGMSLAAVVPAIIASVWLYIFLGVSVDS